MTKNRAGEVDSGRKSHWPDCAIVQRTVAQIPWRSNVPLDRG